MIVFTAVVGILNKQAIAIAADSAVTLGGTNGRKILNKANKVFTLSKYHPIGIMIYNSASFMGTPWETIVKIYRKQIGDKSFSTVREYQKDFIDFLKINNFFTSPDDQISYLRSLIKSILQRILNEVSRENQDLVKKPSKNNLNQFLNMLETKIDEITSIFNHKNDYCSEMEDYTIDSFIVYSDNVFEEIFQDLKNESGITFSKQMTDKFKRFIYVILRAKEEHWSYTGLIFVGFGEDEIYPQLIPVNISIVLDNRLRYYIEENNSASISNKFRGAIRPFAQTDVIDTILSGIDPSLDEIYLNNFYKLFVKYNEEILKAIGNNNPQLTAQIKALDIDKIAKIYERHNNQIKTNKYINPLMNAVSTLSKEDLAEMAESLIYLTYLKRRITFAEESVGGPVDVAIISKGDGFIWIKRKHYFEPELNKHFFESYFKQ